MFFNTADIVAPPALKDWWLGLVRERLVGTGFLMYIAHRALFYSLF